MDLMIASLPKKFSTEQEQLQIIHKLNEQSLELGARMDRAKVEAGKIS